MTEKTSEEGKPTPPAKGKWRRLKKILLVLCALLVGAAVSTYAFRRALFEDLLRAKTVEILRTEAGIEAEIGAIEGTYLTGFRVGTVTLRGDSRRLPQLSSLSAENLEVAFNPLTLLRKGLAGIRWIRAGKSAVTLDLSKKGFEPSPKAGETPSPPAEAPETSGPASPGDAAKPFHEFFVPPLSLAELDAEIRGDDFTFHAKGVALSSGGTRDNGWDALLSWDRWSLLSGARRFSGEKAFLRFQKKGAVLDLRHIEADGRVSGEGRVTLPDTLDAGQLKATLEVNGLGLGRARLRGSITLPEGKGFMLGGSVEGLDLDRLGRTVGGIPLRPFGLLDIQSFSIEGGRFALSEMKGKAEGVRLKEAGLPDRIRMDWLEVHSASLQPGLKGSLTARGAWQGGLFSLEASGGRGADCTIRVSVQAEDLGPVVPELPKYPLDAVVEVWGRTGGDGDDLVFAGKVHGKGKSILGIPDGGVDFICRIDEKGFALDSVSVVTAGGKLTGSLQGSFPLERHLVCEAEIDVREAEKSFPFPLVESLGVAGAMHAKISASLRDGAWTGTSDVTLRDGRFQAFGADFLEMGVDLAKKKLEVLNLVVKKGRRRLEIPFFEARFDGGGMHGTLPFVQLKVGEEALVSTRKVAFSVGKESFLLSPLELKGDWARIRLAGQLKHDGSLSGLLVGDRILLDRVAHLLEFPFHLSGSASFLFEVEGTSRSPRIRGDLSSWDIQVGDLPPSDIEVQGMAFQDGRVTLEKGEIWSGIGAAEIGSLVLPLFPRGVPMDQAPPVVDTLLTDPDLHVALNFLNLDLAKLPHIGDRLPAGAMGWKEVSLRGPLTDPKFRGEFSCTGVKVKDVPPCRLEGKILGDGRGLVLESRGKPFELDMAWGRLRCSGRIPMQGGVFRSLEGRWCFDPLATEDRFSLKGRATRVDLARILEATRAPERYRSLQGVGQLQFRIEGSWEHPVLEVKGEVDRIRSRRMKKGAQVRFLAEYEDGEATLRELEVDLDKGFVEAEARLPLHLGRRAFRGEVPILPDGARLDGEIEINSIPLELASEYVEGLSRTGGKVDGKWSLFGPVRKPKIRGDFRLSEGVLVLQDPTLPTFDSLFGRIALDGRNLTFRLSGNTGGGRVRTQGGVKLDREWQLETITMDLQGSDRPLLWKGEDLRARADFHLQLKGSPKKADLKGKVKVFYTLVDLRHDLGATGTGAKRLVPGFELPSLEQVSMDVAIETPEGFRLKSEIHQRGISLADFDVRLRGNFRLTGDTKNPVLLGNIHTESGTADLPFYRLNIVTGNLNFLEGNPDDPQIHVLAKTTKGDTTIFVTVNGSLATNEVRFYSEPPMPEGDIQAYLATGVRPEAWRGERAGETLGVQIATLIAKQISPYVFGKGGGSGMGLLDRLSFSSERDEITGASRYRAEFRMLNWLWLVGERDEYGNYAGRLKGRVGFKSRREEVKTPEIPRGEEGESVPLPFEVRFEGSGVLGEGEMKETVVEDLRRYAQFGRHPSYLEDAAYRLKLLHQRQGYHHAQVRGRFHKDGEESAVVFHITAGPWVQLRRVRFQGNTAFSDKELAVFFENEKFLPVEFGKRRFVLREVERGLSRVEAFYRNAGYFQAKVEFLKSKGIEGITWPDPETPGGFPDTARVRVLVREGPRATICDVIFEGSDVGPKRLFRQIGNPIGRPFSPSMPLKFRNDLTRFFANRGYPFCKVHVTPDINEKTGDVAFQVKIHLGPLSRIGRVVPEGNRMTLDAVVRHIAGFREGEVFRSDQVREATTKLMRTGLFQSVEIQPVPRPGEPGQVDLNVKVTEADDFVLTASIGAGSYAFWSRNFKFSTAISWVRAAPPGSRLGSPWATCRWSPGMPWGSGMKTSRRSRRWIITRSAGCAWKGCTGIPGSSTPPSSLWPKCSPNSERKFLTKSKEGASRRPSPSRFGKRFE
jgi:hypothetical protein